MRKNLIKFFLVVVGSIVLYWANGGIENNVLNLIQTVILILGWQILACFPRFHRYVMWLSVGFLTTMVLCYLVYQIEWSGFFGSTGMGLFFIYVVAKSPTLVREGQI